MRLRTQILRHWIAITITTITLTLGVFALTRAVGTIGKPFAGFFFGPNLLVSITQRAAWPGIERGLKSLDQIIAVDGTSVEGGKQLRDKVRASQQGDTLIYQVKSRDGTFRNIGIPVSRYTLNDFLIGFLAPFLMGMLFLFFGVILYFAQPESRGSLLYLTLSCVVGAFCMTIYEAYTTFALFRVTLVYPIIGALSAHLFAKFPTRRISRPRVKAVVGAVYLFAAVLIIWRQIALFDVGESAVLSKLSSVFVLLVLTVDLLLLIRAYQQASNQAIRDRIKVIGIGLLIASSVVALWSLNFLLISESFYLDEGVLLASVFPLFMAYAILRKNVFELDRVIRLTLSNGIAAAIVLALYLSVVAALHEWSPMWMASRLSGPFLVVLAIVGAALFNALRMRVNQWVHRFIFQSRYDLASALLELDNSLDQGMGRTEVVQTVGKRISDFFFLERAGVVCSANAFNDHPLVRVYRWPDAPALDKWLTLFESEGFVAYLSTHGIPVDVIELMEETPDRFRQSLATLKANAIEVVVPFVSGNTLLGLMVLGRKGSKEPFDGVDFRLLHPIAVRVSTMLKNADLGTAIESQARLAALGKMSSIMIHDIKNPLSTIRTSASSLKRRFREGDHSHELATIIEEEVDRMNQTIAEILTFAKPAGLSLAQISANDMVEDIVHRMKPIFAKSSVQVLLETCADNPLVEMDLNLIRRAVENLLTNAREATQNGGVVKIRTVHEGKNGSSRFLIVVEDTGSGMEASVRERIFEPFYTTKTGGTGLGLALVKQIVAQHGGDVILETKPGAGTRFTLQFPMQPVKTTVATS